MSIFNFEDPVQFCSKYSFKSSNSSFVKSACFSPDGSSLLVNTESSDNQVTILTVDQSLIESAKYYQDVASSKAVSNLDSPTNGLTHFNTIQAGESVYDLKWYPFMNVQDSSTNLFVTTIRDHPVQLWSAASGQVLHSYNAHNAMDELISPLCVTFNVNGNRLYAGSNRNITVFDISEPGKNYTLMPTSDSKKSPLGQRGIISTLSFSPDYSGVYAAGSYAHNISIYVENEQESVLALRELPMAVTCMKWSPCGTYLWAGGRCHEDIR